MTSIAGFVAASGPARASRNRGFAPSPRHPDNFLFLKDFPRQREHEARHGPDLKIQRLRLGFRQMCVKWGVIGAYRDLEFVDVVVPDERADSRQTCGPADPP